MSPDQHFTVNVEPFKRIIVAASLRGARVLEIGAGHGEITQLILDEEPAHLRAYELEPGLCSLKHSALELCERSFVLGDVHSMRGWCMVSVPPYTLLGLIRESLTWLAPSRVILLVPRRVLPAFSDFSIYETIDGATGFEPPSNGEHAIIYRGFRIPNVQARI